MDSSRSNPLARVISLSFYRGGFSSRAAGVQHTEGIGYDFLLCRYSIHPTASIATFYRLGFRGWASVLNYWGGKAW